MKKLVVAILTGMLAVVPFAGADISVNLTTALGGLMIHNGTAFPGDLLPAGSLVHLVWSTANSYGWTGWDGGSYTMPANSWIIFSGFSNQTGGWDVDLDGGANYGNAAVGGNNINAGYIYLRVFDSAAPAEGSWYASSLIYNTTSFGNSTNIPTPTPDQIEMTTGPGSTFDDGNGIYLLPLNQGQIVPEPTTLALALAGLGLLVYRRFRK